MKNNLSIQQLKEAYEAAQKAANNAYSEEASENPFSESYSAEDVADEVFSKIIFEKTRIKLDKVIDFEELKKIREKSISGPHAAATSWDGRPEFGDEY